MRPSAARRGYMTASYVADVLRDVVRDMPAGLSCLPLPIAEIDRLHLAGIPGMDSPFFDMTLNDGRVYRVRVSDITPEGE